MVYDNSERSTWMQYRWPVIKSFVTESAIPHLCRTVPRQYTGKSMGEEKGTRYYPEAYLAQKRNNPQKKAAAREEAVEVARFLSEKYGARVY